MKTRIAIAAILASLSFSTSAEVLTFDNGDIVYTIYEPVSYHRDADGSLQVQAYTSLRIIRFSAHTHERVAVTGCDKSGGFAQTIDENGRRTGSRDPWSWSGKEWGDVTVKAICTIALKSAASSKAGK